MPSSVLASVPVTHVAVESGLIKVVDVSVGLPEFVQG